MGNKKRNRKGKQEKTAQKGQWREGIREQGITQGKQVKQSKKRESFTRGAKNDNKVKGTKYGSKKGKQKKIFKNATGEKTRSGKEEKGSVRKFQADCPVVRTPHSDCCGCSFDPWSEN